MNIYVEGLDGSGKTTTIQALKKRLGNYTVMKGSSFEITSQGKNIFLPYFYTLTMRKNLICDRFIFSNWIYATVFSDYEKLDKIEFEFLQKEMAKNGFMVFLYCSEEETKKRLKVRGEDYVKENQLQIISDLYQKAITESVSELNIMSIDTTNKSTDEIVDEIIANMEFLKKWKFMNEME
jgi:thymidylate kinase